MNGFPRLRAPLLQPKTAAREVAVVDVGSNSVRLVLYRVEGRAIWTVFNEKVQAGLGRDLTQTGRLSPEGITAALGALRRFKAVLDGVRPDAIYTAATAAVRDASDRDAFLARVRHETSLNLRVLSGVEEGYYAALGATAGDPGAGGLVGDLGGSSLELTPLSAGHPGAGETLPLGPLALGSTEHFDAARVAEACLASLAPVAGRFRSDTLYAVGGGWRNLALVHMNMAKYPLQIVHQYEMTAIEALDAAQFVARQSRGSLERIPGVSKKRAETLPHAAVVLEQLIRSLDVKTIAFSAYGLREGLLFEAMPEAVRALDPLVEGCAALGARHAMSERLGPALETWLEPLWRDLEPLFEPSREPVLLAAACRLADIGAQLHPDHRGELAFDLVLRAPIAGQTHAERAFLAAAVFARYTSQNTLPEPSAVDRVLSPERLARARALGAAMRLGCDLSGRSVALLETSQIARSKDDLLLTVKGAWADMLLGEQTSKRAQAVAQALNLKLKIRTR